MNKIFCFVILLMLFSCSKHQKSDFAKLTWEKGESKSSEKLCRIVDSVNISELKLTDSLNVNRKIIDSLISKTSFVKDHANYIVSNYIFNCTGVQMVDYNSKQIKVFQIYWNREINPYFDFSSSFFYTSDFGIIYRYYPSGRSKDFIFYRLLNYNVNHEDIDLNDFTKKVLKIFDKQQSI